MIMPDYGAKVLNVFLQIFPQDEEEMKAPHHN
jgi:hypothetical protein